MITKTKNRATTGKATVLGLLLAALMAVSLMLGAGTAHASTTFTVTNTNDSGAGSLRQAMLDANNTAGADIINFAIPGSGVATISPQTDLPTITEQVTINGYSQPGAQPNQKAVGSDAVLKVELSGANAPSSAVGLRIGASNSTVKGFVINRWKADSITIGGSDATGNKITGNYIGTDASGTQNVGNSYYGVYSYGANNTIGGTTLADRNVISGNFYGVFISTPGGNKVMGNYIGTDASGTAPLGNSSYGVYIGGANNTIGGTQAGARNVISANGLDGVVIADGTGNRILSNSIFSNGRLGIDLDGDGATTPNDPKDPDTGANNLQNYPVLSSAKKSATGTTTVRGNLNSTPNKTFQLQFFSNPSGTDEGKALLGSKSITTAGTGNVSFAFSTQKAIRLGQNITATGTGPGGNTSEFSAPRKVVAQ